jgi:TRAP-type C4-dicarboxylate transport system permease small subunit
VPTRSTLGLFERIHRRIEQCEEAILGLLLMALIGIGLAQIVARNGFGVALPWADGAMRSIVLWLAMLAGALAASRLKHIRIDIGRQWFSAGVRQWLHSLTLLATAGVCLAMSWFSLRMVALEYEFETMAFAGVPTWVVQFIVPVGFALMAARFAAHALSPAPDSPADAAGLGVGPDESGGAGR